MTRLVSYAGTNHRLRRALARMRAGKPFTMAAIGGSVSMGHGLKAEEPKAYSELNMHTRVFAWLDAQFPAAAGSVQNPAKRPADTNVYVNGAQPARGGHRAMRTLLTNPRRRLLLHVQPAACPRGCRLGRRRAR